ncbi:hypothetical protein GLOIN_2v1528652 [Rhizophagus clarus]|uniref:Uncharacterized protein n=1 Tax=Rhizophagus clarus TaxID=94130 RepID=A0A8H3QRT7_9GLOM|nr:hypothetical protein GLOIN_2v1528652 [Rhizophagus clarus]
MTSGSPLPIETYLKEWENICTNFYVNNDELAGTIVGLVEFASHSNETITLNFSTVDQTVAGKKEDLEKLLNKIGFVNGTMLLPQEFNKYLETKRKIRSEFHRKKAEQLQEELDRLLNSKPAQYTPLHRRSELTTFINQYNNSVGAKPFIKGLLHMFKLQLNQSNLASWTFLDDIFTQNGPDFMRASVNLLINVLSFTHTVQQADESGQENTYNKVRATGTVELSSQQRPAEMITSEGNISKLCYLPFKFFLFWWNLAKLWLNFCCGIIGFKKNHSSVSSELHV